MNKFDILCDVVLSVVIPCELVSNRIFVMHTLPLLSMVEINGKPPLTGAGGRPADTSTNGTDFRRSAIPHQPL